MHDRNESTRILKFDWNSQRITEYNDAAFATNSQLSSQLRIKVLLTDDNHIYVPVSYISYRPWCIVRPILFAEVITLANLSGDALAIRKKFELVLRQSKSVHILSDSKSLFGIIPEGSSTNEKRVMLDTYAARQEYKAQEISNMDLVRSSHTLVDWLS